MRSALSLGGTSLLLALSAACTCPAPRDSAVSAQAEEIYQFALSELQRQRPLWSEEAQVSVAAAFREATMASFPEGVSSAKMGLLRDMAHEAAKSNYARIVPEMAVAEKAVLAWFIADLARTPVMGPVERRQRDAQLEELAGCVRSAIAGLLPAALASEVHLDEAVLTTELDDMADECAELFLQRASSEADMQTIRGLKRPLTAEEMDRARQWATERGTKPDMPRRHVDLTRAAVDERLELARFVARGLAHGLVLELHAMTSRPFPDEVEALRDVGGRYQAAESRYRPVIGVLTAATLGIGGMWQPFGAEALVIPFP